MTGFLRTKVEAATVAERLRSVLGPEGVGARQGIPVARPGSDEETVAVLRAAGEHGWRVLPLGAGLGPDALVPEGNGGAVESGDSSGPDLIVASDRLGGVVAHEPGDLNVRVRAGCTRRELHTQVWEHAQWLACDPPGGAEVTIGGIVATGLSGPLAGWFGRPRDQLLGLTLVDGSGCILRLGGRVVKNVAGFDLVRLAAGSRGAFGMVTEVTLRLFPRAEEDRTLVWQRDDLSGTWELGRRLAMLPVPVAAAEVLSGQWPQPVPTGRSRVLIRLLGSHSEVSEVTGRLTREGGAPDGDHEGVDSVAIWEAVSSGQRADGSLYWVEALPSRTAELVDLVEGVGSLWVVAGALSGNLRGRLSDDVPPGALQSLAERVRSVGGRFGRSGGGGLRGSGQSTESSRALGRIKRELVNAFDPHGLLPGAWREGWTTLEAAG